MRSKIEINQREKNMFGESMRKVAVVLLFFVTQVVSAQGKVVLNDIKFAELPGDRFEVRMTFDGPPPEPEAHKIIQPARIWFDFPGVESSLAVKKYPLSFSNAKSAVVLTSEGRTRFIVNLQAIDEYKARIDGNSYVLEVGSDDIQEVIKKSNSMTDQISSDHQGSVDSKIVGIDFRRGDQGEGKVIIDLSNPSININIDQSGGNINLSFSNTELPVDMRRKLDVVDFATPVSSISSSYDGASTTVSIKASGDYDYLAYQTDNKYVVSVKPLSKSELAEKNSKFQFTGEKLSLNFQDIAVRSVLQLIADFTGKNLVASDTVKGNITLRLENVPWDQALDLVLKAKGLDKREIGNVLMVAPASEIADRERKEIETNKQLSELAPLRTEYIQILYADASKVFELFKGKGSGTESVLSSRGSAIVDSRTNTIILTETDQKIEEFRALIKHIDQPIRQVSIESRIVKANDDYRRDLGVKWGFFQDDTLDVSTSKTLFGSGKIDSVQGAPPTGVGGLALDMAAIGAPSIAVGLVSGSDILALELSAMETTGHGEIVSQPKVVTGDKQLATIRQGTEIPYQEASSSGATSTSFKEAVLKLEVTPQITPDDHIIMDLTVTNDKVGPETSTGIPSINTFEVKTKVLVDNGQTFVIGGIFEQETQATVNKVPFMGDLPVIGRFFRRNVDKTSKTETLIFITPRIVQDPLAKN